MYSEGPQSLRLTQLLGTKLHAGPFPGSRQEFQHRSRLRKVPESISAAFSSKEMVPADALIPAGES